MVLSTLHRCCVVIYTFGKKTLALSSQNRAAQGMPEFSHNIPRAKMKRVYSLMAAKLKVTGARFSCVLVYECKVEESEVPEKHGSHKDGMKGHHHACWNHCLSSEDVRTIRNGGFLVSLIHGSQDIVAPFGRAVALTKRLSPSARLVAPNGGHLVIQECTAEVNVALRELLEAAEANMDLAEWSGSHQPADESVKDLPHDETRVQWPEDSQAGWSKNMHESNSLHIPLTLESQV